MLRVTIRSELYADPGHWIRLQQEALPRLLARNRPFRALCCGCGPGLEAWSLAFLLHDAETETNWSIGAFDTDREAISVAKAGGPYALREVRALDAADRARFFTAGMDGFVVAEALRSRVSFRVADLRDLALPDGLDLILYRNVEPFFSPRENDAVLTRFAAALRPGGIVFVSQVDRITGLAATGLVFSSRGFLQRPVAETVS